jgi:hypothetical protein
VSARDLFPEAGDQFTRYRAEIQIRELIVGGVPSDPSVIRKWLAARMELGDAQMEELVQQTLAERDDRAFTSTAEAIDLVMASELAPSVNGFKRTADGELAYEGRCMKAALKEWVNSAYPGTEWDGKKGAKGVAPRKGLMSTLAERVFVVEPLIGLGVKAGDLAASHTDGETAWVEERIKHVMTPKGPRSSINKVEVVHRPTLALTIAIRDDFLSREAWGRIWQTGEEIGIGADRGRSDGTFDLTEWERL